MTSPSSKSQARKFQAPKGTRDFYPADLAVRRHIENVWREVSVNHGFEEIDGPTFEHLDLYTHKSGPGIASELFQVFSGKDPEQAAAIRAGEMAPFALRPEFTPTLARMVAARAPELPRPIKWFAIPSHFRAESPQRGRLREFMQWNVDFIGGEDRAQADAEIIATALNALQLLGLNKNDLTVVLNDRRILEANAKQAGTTPEQYEVMLWVRDNWDRLPEADKQRRFDEVGITNDDVDGFFRFLLRANEVVKETSDPIERSSKLGVGLELLQEFTAVQHCLDRMGFSGWWRFDAGMVRGLAYYTGTVFEIIAEGERAIAGGGRYDKLIESFGGPSLPACGFGMGDVVLANILRDKGLLKPDEEYLPRPDAFVIAASDDAAARLPAIVADLRRSHLHVRQSYKTTRHVGKLLGDAGKCRARHAVILGAQLGTSEPRVALKDMDSGDQREVALSELAAALRAPQSP
jgi:histidyl-tRNA synthetase